MDEFFVGYLPVPAGVRRFVRRAVALAIALAAVVAVVLVLTQARFPASRFDFGEYRDYQGALSLLPYPALSGGWLVVAPGKHGAAGLPAGYVKLKGALIRNGDDRMLELLPGSVQPAAGAAAPSTETDLGPVEWTGEIVDSKCYFGVMNPGRGKVHRDCAARCIAGGIPPALLVRDAAGLARTVLVAGSDRRPLSAEVRDFIAEPVRVRGRLVRFGGRLLLLAEPRDFRRE